ncbi:MAG: MBL fold metallo-hydrolase [Candidatus Poseidoniaceae archaeon]|jgi:glyoxylase-like metal-dependent hydrolase (beta-lactamase superfamily II)|nr:MBL fold metallo-hydrolase [Candidatus Poseidoniaceae archaeon]
MVKNPSITHFYVTALEQRCSVVTNPNNGETVIIDGGGDSDRIISWIDSNEGVPDAEIGSFTGKRKVVALLNTHAHFDHSGHIPFLKEHYGVDWWMHDDDAYLQSLAKVSGERWGFQLPEPAIADYNWNHGELHTFAGMDFEIIHTPGHTLGGCCLRLIVEDGSDHLFAGDTLFQGSIGRTDLPHSGGDMDLLLKMIRERLWPLNDDTIVHPGHGPLTTIGYEKSHNPFLNGEGYIGRGAWL